MYNRNKKSWMKHIDFILVDFVCIQIAFLMAYGIRHFNISDRFVLAYEIRGYRMLCIMMAIMHFCIVFFTNNYSGILRRGRVSEFVSVISHNALLLGLTFAYIVLMRFDNDVSRLTIIMFGLFNVFFMFAVRTIMKAWMRDRNTAHKQRHQVLVITTLSKAHEVMEQFKETSYAFNVVGFALVPESHKDKENTEVMKEIDGIPVIASDINMAYEYSCRNVVDEVFVYLPQSVREIVDEVADMFLQMGITIHINLEHVSKGLPNVAVEKFGQYTVLTSSVNVMTPFGVVAKRLIDIAAGIVGCIITGIIFIFLAPAIKIADPGPIFFGQKRAGKNGRVFTIYKFRSMYVDAEERKKELMKNNKMEGLMFKMDSDPRIIGSGPDGTRKGLGYWIRTLSLDEFPNFYSILKGDMSLVGTRPPTMDEFERYSPHHKSRLAAKPGLTGMWQVSGRSDMTNFEEIVAMDTEYIKNWSLGLDIRIILKTFVVVLKRKGSI